MWQKRLGSSASPRSSMCSKTPYLMMGSLICSRCAPISAVDELKTCMTFQANASLFMRCTCYELALHTICAAVGFSCALCSTAEGSSSEELMCCRHAWCASPQFCQPCSAPSPSLCRCCFLIYMFLVHLSDAVHIPTPTHTHTTLYTCLQKASGVLQVCCLSTGLTSYLIKLQYVHTQPANTAVPWLHVAVAIAASCHVAGICRASFRSSARPLT